MDKEGLKRKASELPEGPGVYLMKDSRGRTIYIGKAKSLRKRVLSYFQKTALGFKTEIMVPRITDLEFILTDNEKEALILENSLIKRHKPRYNARLKDDKTHPYLQLTMQETFPRLALVRKIKKDGAMYFGPFSSTQAMRKTLRLVQRLFPLRQCRQRELKKADRPCLNYELGRCSAPCVGLVSPEEYRALVDEVALFFRGRNKKLTETLEKKMREASGRLDFESASRYRDRLNDVEKTLEHQKMVSTDMKDLDIIGLAQESGQILVAQLFVRRGVFLGSRNFYLSAAAGTLGEIIGSLLGQYYGSDNLIPDEVLTSVDLESTGPLQEWLGEKKGRKVQVKHPVRGPKKKLVDLAVTNARTALADRLRAVNLGIEASFEIQRKLGLPEFPGRIEGYDLSTLRGDSPVGAMVVLDDGEWSKRDYRRFRIKTASGQDDYAMMYEIISRRLQKENLPRPDLMLLDGGRGQLGMALAVIKDLHIEDPPPLAGLAKGKDGQPDRVYRPGRKNPINFRPGAPGLLLLMRVRDEAHRFVQDYHHRLRRKNSTRSALENIAGIGPARRKALLKHFHSVEAVKKASVEDLAGVEGLSRTAAESVYHFFHAGKHEAANGR
jgi:excinuclease ABC subunit C